MISNSIRVKPVELERYDMRLLQGSTPGKHAKRAWERLAVVDGRPVGQDNWSMIIRKCCIAHVSPGSPWRSRYGAGPAG